MNISYKLLSSLSFEEAHALFNRGFEGYLIPMNLPFEPFVGRFGNEGLSPSLSIAMYDGVQPIGFVLQGIREVKGQKISWNGGTGIVPAYRGRKLGVSLLEQAEKLLRENNVSVATLEAIVENKAAITLYEKFGYQIKDDLLFLSGNGVLNNTLPIIGDYDLLRIPAFQTIDSGLFPTIIPWQTDASITPKMGGEAVIIKSNGSVQAACLIRKRWIFEEKVEGITLFQVTENGNKEALEILLAYALEYDQPINRTTYNFLKGNGRVVSSLMTSGFEKTSISQIFMTKILE